MNEFLNSPALTIFLVCLVPTASCCALNMHFFTTRQMLNSLGIAALLGCVLGTGTWWLHGLLAPIAAQHGVPGKALLAGGFILCIFGVFYTLHERFFSETMPKTQIRYTVLGTLVLFAGLTAFYAGFLFLSGIFFVLLVLSVFDGKRNCTKRKELLFNDYEDISSAKSSKFVQKEKNVTFHTKPNIYLLFLESYQSKNALESIYEIVDSVTESVLLNNSFEVYSNFYSNSSSTIFSCYDLFTGKINNQYARENFVTQVLKANNYALNYIDTSACVFHNFAENNDYVSFYMPKRVKFLFMKLIPFFSQSSFLRKFVGGADPFNTDIDEKHVLESLQNRMRRADQKPQFYALRFGAEHNSYTIPVWQKDASKHIESYKKAFHKGQELLKEVTDHIAANDPEALVIAVGDHGGHRHAGALDGADLGTSFKKYGLTIKDIADSLFSVVFAVRWPVPHKMQGRAVSSVNIFRFVFEALSGDASLLEDMAPNMSMFGETIFVKEGKVLDVAEKMVPEDLTMGEALEKYKNGTATYQELQLLYRAMHTHWQGDKAIDVITYINKNIGKHCLEDLALADIQMAYGRQEALETCYTNVQKYARSFQLCVIQYIRVLFAHGRVKDAINFLDTMSPKNQYAELESRVRLASLLGDTQQAEAKAKLLCVQHATIPDAWALYSRLVARNARPEEAMQVVIAGIAHFESAQNATPCVALKVFYASQCVRYGQLDKAEEVLRRNIAEGDCSAWSKLLLSYIYEQQKRPEQALKILLGKDQTVHSGYLLARIGELAALYSLNDEAFEPYIVFAKKNLHASIHMIEESGVFDAQWYKATWMQPQDTMQPIRHYLRHGVYTGANPTPWFDTNYYLSQVDIWDTGVNPLLHFIQHGLHELRMPSLWADPVAVAAKNPRVTGSQASFLRAMNRMYGQNMKQPSTLLRAEPIQSCAASYQPLEKGAAGCECSLPSM